MIRNSPLASASRPLLALLLAFMLPVPAALANNQIAAPQKLKTSPVRVAAADALPARLMVAKTKPAPAAAKAKPGKTAPAEAGKPVLIATYGDWGAYAAQTGKSKTCYALSQPKDRAPSSLKRDPSYIFISTRPAEGVRNEISFVMGFTVKSSGANSTSEVKIGTSTIAMVAEGSNLWVKNAAEENQLLDAMKKGQKLTVRAASTKGNVTTDTYSMSGITQAIDRVQKECS